MLPRKPIAWRARAPARSGYTSKQVASWFAAAGIPTFSKEPRRPEMNLNKPTNEIVFLSSELQPLQLDAIGRASLQARGYDVARPSEFVSPSPALALVAESLDEPKTGE